jgi:predicted pyridoxine 5'-phosphate oxidase superfamily flavin-nucleotide-binding protein
MTALPEVVSSAWDNRDGPIVLTTVDAEKTPNAIYATCVGKQREDLLVVADDYFSKTRANILDGSKASLLFLTKDEKSYQVKGTIELHCEGPLFEEMKRWNPTHLPGRVAAALSVEQVFSGAERLA